MGWGDYPVFEKYRIARLDSTRRPVVASLSRTTKAHPKAIMMSAANSLASRSSVVPARVRGARKTTVSAIDTPRYTSRYIHISLSERGTRKRKRLHRTDDGRRHGLERVTSLRRAGSSASFRRRDRDGERGTNG